MPETLDSIATKIDSLQGQAREQSLQKAVVRLHVMNLEMPSANTEYEYRLPPGCKMFIFHCRDATALRASFSRGKVASSVTGDPGYLTIKANSAWAMDNLNILEETFVYFACGTAAKVIEGVIGR